MSEDTASDIFRRECENCRPSFLTVEILFDRLKNAQIREFKLKLLYLICMTLVSRGNIQKEEEVSYIGLPIIFFI